MPTVSVPGTSYGISRLFALAASWGVALWSAGCSRPTSAPVEPTSRPSVSAEARDEVSSQASSVPPSPPVTTPAPRPPELLIVASDVTRPLWAELAAAFVASFPADQAPVPEFRQADGGSPSQTPALSAGDIAAPALPAELLELRECGAIHAETETVALRSIPATSSVVFLIRQGNPKGLRNWPDLVRPDIRIVCPNPRTSGVGRLVLLSAWADVVDRGGSDGRALAFVTDLAGRITTWELDSRSAIARFRDGTEGDVLLTLECEAYLAIRSAPGKFEVAYPRSSLLVELPVTVVDAVVDRRGTRSTAEAFREFLFSAKGQAVLARLQWRPMAPAALAESPTPFPEVRRIPISDIAENWTTAQRRFFGSEGLLERLSPPPRE